MIYFYYFRFRQLFEQAMLKPKLQILRCAHAQKQMGRIYNKNAAENYKKRISLIFWLGQNMENDVNS